MEIDEINMLHEDMFTTFDTQTWLPAFILEQIPSGYFVHE